MARNKKLLLLPGDGIGPEVMAEMRRVIDWFGARQALSFEVEEDLVGGASYDERGTPCADATMDLAMAADAVLLGAVGGPKWEDLPPDIQPERGALLPLRKHFGLFANLRPGVCHPSLIEASPVKNELIADGFNVLCVRELTGGIYFGSPKERREENGEEVAIDTMVYRRSEIERIAHVAFQAAQGRRKKICSVDKANVLQNSRLWRETVEEVAREYPDVELSHLYVDNAAMQLIRYAPDYDVIVTGNLFGDILSDELAMISGSLGMLPSASLGASGEDGCNFGLYEPSGGSAPDIAGQGIANPIAQILSLAMLLRHSLAEDTAADRIETAVEEAIGDGFRTGDIFSGSQGEKRVNTVEMGAAIRDRL